MIAASTLVPYFLVQGLTAPIVWNLLFTSINLREIYRLLRERRPVHLSEREECLHSRCFASLGKREFRTLMEAASWSDAAPDSEIVATGQVLDQLRVIHEGEAQVLVDDRGVASIGEGRFVGEMSYLTGEPTCAAVRATRDTTLVSWPNAALDSLSETNPSIRAALQRVVSSDLANKLRGASSGADRA